MKNFSLSGGGIGWILPMIFPSVFFFLLFHFVFFSQKCNAQGSGSKSIVEHFHILH